MKQYLKTILSEHINSRPEYLVAMFKQLYFETAIKFKERMNSKEKFRSIQKDLIKLGYEKASDIFISITTINLC